MTKRFTQTPARTRARGNNKLAAVMASLLSALLLTSARGAEPLAVEPAAIADFRVVYQFDGTEGGTPYTALVRGADGAMYGTTWNFGPSAGGTVFRLGPAGHVKLVAAFNYNGSSGPTGPLLLAPDGNFYGVADGGAATIGASVFRVTPAGVITTLHGFLANDDPAGSNPAPGLVLGPDGALYGTTLLGGANGAGTVYRMTLAGDYSIVHSFNGTDGAVPRTPLTLGPDGLFYGTTAQGGDAFSGTLFKMDLQGNVTTLHVFAGPPNDGAQPLGPLVIARDGRLYGTTSTGGANNMGTVFRLSRNEKRVHLLHSFAADGVDGTTPWGALLQASNGRFYGTTSGGGPLPSVCNGGAGCGTLFEITEDGRYQVVHQFTTGPGGQYPIESLYEAEDGRLYGAAYGDSNLPTDRLGALFSIRQR